MHKYNCYLYGAFLDVDPGIHECLKTYSAKYAECEKCIADYEAKHKMGWVPNDKLSW